MKCINVFVYYGFVPEGTFNFFLEAFLLVLHFPFPESQFFFWVLHSLKFGPWTGLSATEWTKKIGSFHHYHTRNHLKEKRLQGKKKQGNLDCTFRGGWYSSWAQISWSWSADVKCFKQIHVLGLAVVGNLSNTDKRRWGQGTIVPAHSVLDLKKETALFVYSRFFRVVLFAEGNISKVTAGSCLCTFVQTNVSPTGWKRAVSEVTSLINTIHHEKN